MNTATNPIITRKQYMDNSSELHHDYYAQFVTDATRQWVINNIGMKKLLSSKCEYFNDLGIKYSHGGAGPWLWDFAPYNLEAMREAGEVSPKCLPSQSAITCTAKACARILVREAKAKG